MVITHVMMCCSGICVPNFFVHRDWAGAKCHTIFIFVIVIWLVEDCWLSKLMWESADPSEQGRSTISWHARSIRFPRPYHHLTSNFKLYPISHLKPTGTYTDQLTLPFRIYSPNFSMYDSFCDGALLGKILPNRSWKYNAVNAYFYFFIFFCFLAGKPWRKLESPHLVTVKRGPRLRDWERSTIIIRNTTPTLSIRASASFDGTEG